MLVGSDLGGPLIMIGERPTLEVLNGGNARASLSACIALMLGFVVRVRARPCQHNPPACDIPPRLLSSYKKSPAVHEQHNHNGETGLPVLLNAHHRRSFVEQEESSLISLHVATQLQLPIH